MTVNFAGHIYDDAGSAVNGASVKLLETGTTTQEGSTVTSDSNGAWAFTESDQDRYDVEITKGTSVRRIRWDDQISLKEIDVRNNTGATTPAATLTNLTNSVANQVAVFSGANSTRADGDEIYLSFKLADSAGNLDEFARMTVEATDVTTTSEDGQIRFGVIVAGTMTDVFTINSSTGGAATISYEVDSFTIKGGEGEAGVLYLFADQGDDAGDEWKVNVADGGVMTIGNDIASAGTYVTHMTITPHATIASSSVAIAGDATVGDDLSLTSDSAVLSFGADGDTTLTHTDGTGLTLNSTNKLTFGDTGTFIHQSSDGVLTITSDTTVDINGAVAFDGAITGATNITLSGELDAATLDISGNADIDGTTNLDAVDIDGAVQIDAAFTSGVDGQGYDTKFFGDTSGAYILWDTSEDKLLTAGGAVVDIVKDKLLIGGTAVTTTAAELNVLDAVTAGTVSASLGVVVDSNKDIGSFRNITLTGELDAATLDLSSSADIAGDLVLSGGADGALQFTNAGENSIKIPDNQASALIIEEADNAYITFVTTNSSEAITVAKATTFSVAATLATGSTIGNLTLADGSITDSGGALDFGNETLTTTGAVDFGAATVDSLTVSDANITNVGDIALDSISADGTDINVAVSDNSATALTIKQGSDAYLIVDTANSSESVSIGTGISGTAITLGHSTSETTVADNLTVTGTAKVTGTTEFNENVDLRRDSSSSKMTLRSWGNGVYGQIRLFAGRGSEGSPEGIEDTNELGRIQFLGTDGSGEEDEAGFIRAVATQDWAGDAHGSAIEFVTITDGETSQSNVRLTIGEEGDLLVAGDLDFSGAHEISTSSSTLTLNPTTDTVTKDGTGLVIGHTGQAAATGMFSLQPEFQVLGTGGNDGSMLLATFSATASVKSTLNFFKSRHGTIGSNTLVIDDEDIGGILWHVADGADFTNTVAQILVEMNGTPASGDTPADMTFWTAASGASTPSKRMAIEQDGGVFMYNLGSAGSGTALVIDGSDEIIPSSSSIAYKDNVRTIESDSSRVFDLMPRAFEWKRDGQTDFGLIAEEVHEVMPEMVIYNRDGKPEAVKYDRLSVLLLMELQKIKENLEGK